MWFIIKSEPNLRADALFRPCFSINIKEVGQAVVSQHGDDYMRSLYISEVQLSPEVAY